MTLSALAATITDGAIIATYDDVKLEGAKFTVTFEEGTGPDFLSLPGLLVTIRAEGNPNIHVHSISYVLNTFDVFKRGVDVAKQGMYENEYESYEGSFIKYNRINFRKGSIGPPEYLPSDRIAFNSKRSDWDENDEKTLFYTGLEEKDVLTQWALPITYTNVTTDAYDSSTILPSSVVNVPEPSTTLLGAIAALGLIRRRR